MYCIVLDQDELVNVVRELLLVLLEELLADLVPGIGSRLVNASWEMNSKRK